MLRKKIRANKVWDYTPRHGRKMMSSQKFAGTTFRGDSRVDMCESGGSVDVSISQHTPLEDKLDRDKKSTFVHKDSIFSTTQKDCGKKHVDFKLPPPQLQESGKTENDERKPEGQPKYRLSLTEMLKKGGEAEEDADTQQKMNTLTRQEGKGWNRKIKLKNARIAFPEDKSAGMGQPLDSERRLLRKSTGNDI